MGYLGSHPIVDEDEEHKITTDSNDPQHEYDGHTPEGVEEELNTNPFLQ